LNPHNLAYAALVQSTIAKGLSTRINTAEALKSPGVIQVITYENKPPMKAPQTTGETIPLLNQEIFYSGQTIAVVVAETFEEAEHAAELVHVEYAPEKAEILMDRRMSEAFPYEERGGAKRGDFENAINNAPVKVDQVYRIPVEHHNPME